MAEDRRWEAAMFYLKVYITPPLLCLSATSSSDEPGEMP